MHAQWVERGVRKVKGTQTARVHAQVDDRAVRRFAGPHAGLPTCDEALYGGRKRVGRGSRCQIGNRNVLLRGDKRYTVGTALDGDDPIAVAV